MRQSLYWKITLAFILVAFHLSGIGDAGRTGE